MCVGCVNESMYEHLGQHMPTGNAGGLVQEGVASHICNPHRRLLLHIKVEKLITKRQYSEQ